MILLWIVSIILTALFIFLETWDMAVFGIFFFVFSSIQLVRRRRGKGKDEQDWPQSLFRLRRKPRKQAGGIRFGCLLTFYRKKG